MMQLFVYLLLAAVLGFALGWLIRGGTAGAEAGEDDAARLEAAERQRERLARELDASRAARRDLEVTIERMRAEATNMAVAAAGGKEPQAQLDVAHRRIAELEAELAVARRAQDEAKTRAFEPANDGGALRAAAQAPGQPSAAAAHGVTGVPPEKLMGPQGRADDLKLISGIGPSIEKMLNGLGIYHFRQIAAFTPENVAWVDQRLRFRGRIAREDWIGQARALSQNDRPSGPAGASPP
jgi:predicted flap endonuclease-1-like 5' DNA nuclease